MILVTKMQKSINHNEVSMNLKGKAHKFSETIHQKYRKTESTYATHDFSFSLKYSYPTQIQTGNISRIESLICSDLGVSVEFWYLFMFPFCLSFPCIWKV